MPGLIFPSPDALRSVLAAGLIPGAVARGRVRASVDPGGRVWVEPPATLTREVRAALGRVGVRTGGGGPDPRAYSCWAELVPGTRDAEPAAGPVLFEVAPAAAAGLAAAVRRRRPQPVGVRVAADRAWVYVPDPPPGVAEAVGAGPEPFAEQRPGVWVRRGWRHPLGELIAVPPGRLVLVRPDRPWAFAPAGVNEPGPPGLNLSPARRVADRTGGPPRPTVGIQFRLRPDTRPRGAESLWVRVGSPSGHLAEIARGVDPRSSRGILAAAVRRPGSADRLVLCGPAGGVPGGGPGWCPHPGLPGLHVPAGFRVWPPVRAAELAAAAGLRPGWVGWLEPGPAGDLSVRLVPESAFRPLADWFAYTAPAATAVTCRPGTSGFALPAFVPADHSSDSNPGGPVPSAETIQGKFPPPGGPGWLGRSLGRLLRSGSRPPGKPRRPAAAGTDRSARGPTPAVEFPAANEWAARRAELEARAFADRPGPGADVWAELAAVYAAVGNPADAAVCWVNAVWDRDPPPPAWAAGWLAAECRAARVGRDAIVPADLLAGPPTARAARLAAAYLVLAADRPADPPAVTAGLAALVEAHESNLPARAGWLARVAATRAAGGDALGLARCRDRVFARLAAGGPALDVDAPSVLRYRGGAGGDRFPPARDWLARAREPIHKWVGGLATRGRLQGVGLDPEVRCTAAYADLMLAWGAGRVGDRARATDLDAAAGAVLLGRHGPGVDPAVHRVLVGAFRARIRAALDGRPDPPEPPRRPPA